MQEKDQAKIGASLWASARSEQKRNKENEKAKRNKNIREI